jgi:hypothetical protein
MRNIGYILFVLAAFVTASASAQKAFVLPSPTGANDSIALYIDVNQSSEHGLKQMLIAHPEEVNNVYIWTWNPADPVIGNGSWNNSNDGLKMKHEGNLLFSIKFVPTQFYGVDGPTFFSKGISCLAKLKDGNAHGDMQVGEAKTEDINVSIIPKLCDELYCMFPQQAKADDFLTITYDNTKETNPNLQNLGDGEVYLYIRAAVDLFNSGPEYASQADTPSTPALKMKPVPGEPGHYKLTIVPQDFFAPLLQPNQQILKVRFTVVKPGFTHPPQSVPYTDYIFTNCVD